MDKHLLAENPMRSPEGGLCIIRTIQPVSIYEVIEGTIEMKGICKRYYLNNTAYTLRCHHYFSTDIDTANESEVFKFMDDAWHWYAAYLRWEDEQIDNL